MTSDYRIYPPQLADDVEIIKQRDGDRLTFVVGSASAGRFILLGETECKVLRMLTGSLILAEVCDEFKQRYGARLSARTLGLVLLHKLHQLLRPEIRMV